MVKEAERDVAWFALVPPANPPVTAGVAQLYKVPAGTIPFVPSVGVKVNEVPLQITALIGMITAAGLTIMVTVKAVPVQLPTMGVTM